MIFFAVFNLINTLAGAGIIDPIFSFPYTPFFYEQSHYWFSRGHDSGDWRESSCCKGGGSNAPTSSTGQTNLAVIDGKQVIEIKAKGVMRPHG